MINESLKILKEKTESFAADVHAQFKGERVLVSHRRTTACEAAVEFLSFRLSFVYHIGRPHGPKSVLSCMFFNKNDGLDVGYLAYDILNFIDENDFSCYTYSYIPTEQALESCFDELSKKLAGNIEKIEELFNSPERCAQLRQAKIADINAYFGKDIFEIADGLEGDAKSGYLRHAYDVFFSHMMMRFVSRSYGSYLNGDKQEALRLFGSSRALTAYEKRFLKHLKDGTPAQTTRENYLTEGLVAQSAKSLLLPMLLVFLAISAVLTPAFYGLHHLFISLFAKGALYNTALELENAMFCVVPALVLGAGITASIKGAITALTGKKSRRRYKLYSKILSSEKESFFARYGLYTAAVVAVILSMVTANTGVKFFDKTMKINASPTQLRAVEYTYSSIEEVSETAGQYGTVITTIKFDDGKMFSFISMGEQSSVQTKIYPILQQKGIEIKKSVK